MPGLFCGHCMDEPCSCDAPKCEDCHSGNGVGGCTLSGMASDPVGKTCFEPAGEVPRLKAEIEVLKKRLADWDLFRDQFADITYHEQAMGCGVEDVGMDRYDACRYGWHQALDKVSERMPEATE